MKPIIVLGGGGHARVLLSLLNRCDYTVLGIVDPNLAEGSVCDGVPVLGCDAVVADYAVDAVQLVNGVGALPRDGGLRQQLFNRFKAQGYTFATVIDPTAFVAPNAQLVEGVQVMAGAVVQVGAKIADNVIVNSGAIVEHDCHIGRHVHIAPGAVLSGGVVVEEACHIGTGAVVIQGISIGAGSIIGAGCVITRDIAANHIVYPARSHIQALA
jgi:UDP-perosamine 4-acetyltransferase